MPNEDEYIWASYAKGVKRIKKKPLKEKPPAKTPKTSKPIPRRELAPIKKTHPGVSLAMDRRAERKLRDGDVSIEARLDMHGMTQREAHTALTDFIAKQVKAGTRNLLVITGKGRSGEGVLKANFKDWLENLPDAARILAVRPAAIKHGGSGAFYVILRRSV
jgi:DNA-nicking Smr family endonuclease